MDLERKSTNWKKRVRTTRRGMRRSRRWRRRRKRRRGVRRSSNWRTINKKWSYRSRESGLDEIALGISTREENQQTQDNDKSPSRETQVVLERIVKKRKGKWKQKSRDRK